MNGEGLERDLGMTGLMGIWDCFRGLWGKKKNQFISLQSALQVCDQKKKNP